MSKSVNAPVGRRRFLKHAAAGAAAVAAVPAVGAAQSPAPVASTAPPPLSRARETETPGEVEVLTADRPGSDFMVDVLMHNNRAYHQETMHVVRMANRHQRGITRSHIGTTLNDPNVDFAKLAQGLGVHAEGPITSPGDLGPAIRRALDTVRRGEPALADASRNRDDSRPWSLRAER